MTLPSVVPMVLAEAHRELPMAGARICLALATGLGIVLTCCVRESYYVNGHRLCAVLAFGAGVVLVLLIAALAESGGGAALALVSGLFLTGAGQGANIVADALRCRFRPLPSWALGTLEIGLVIGFAWCMAEHASAGAVVPDGCRVNGSEYGAADGGNVASAEPAAWNTVAVYMAEALTVIRSS